MCHELFHLRSIDIAFCELYKIMDHDQTLPGTVVYLQKDNKDNWSCCCAKIQEHSFCNHVYSDLVQHRILFCIAIDDCCKELWETSIELQGHSAFNRMRCSDFSTQCNYSMCMLVNLNHDTFQNMKLVTLISRMLT